MYRTYKAALMSGLMAMLVLAACGKLSKEGSPPPNNPPVIQFANIPVDSTTFSTNPIIYWYGTDNDGTIEQYQYSVKHRDEVEEYLQSKGISGTVPLPELFIEHATDEEYDWTTIWVDSVQTSTRGEIRLYASFDTNWIKIECDPPCVDSLIDCEIDSVGFENGAIVYDTVNCVSRSIQQYMFIRAIDDDDDVSEIRYRQYLRNNHWPQTKIENANQIAASVYYNLPLPISTYPGIGISWSGSDSADYPRNQPDFEYWWQVFGPFEAAEEADTTPAKLVYDSGDTLTLDGWGRRPLGIWVTSQSTQLVGLWRNEPESDTTRTGYFLFMVRSRDDAFATDPSPSWVTFRAIDAKLERRILFVDDLNYLGNQEPLAPIGSGADGEVDDNLLRNRIFEILRQATGGAVDMDETSSDYYRRVNGVPGHPQSDLAPEMLARYELVLVVDDDAPSPVETSEQARLAEYMNIGGNVWVFGRNSFLAAGKGPGQIREPQLYPAGPVADFYFDVEESFLVVWGNQATPKCNVDYSDPRPADEQCPHEWDFRDDIDDFVGAMPTEENMGIFPILEVDTNLTKDFFIHPGVRDKAGIKDFRFKTIPDANFLVAGTGAEPVYTYVSRYAGTRHMHEKPCAVRYIGPSAYDPIFKTAWFAFSPYAIKTDQIVEVFRVMLAWFEEDVD